MEWEGDDFEGNEWPNSWEPSGNVTKDMVTSYHRRLAKRVARCSPPCEMAPLLKLVRGSVARLLSGGSPHTSTPSSTRT